MQGIKILRTALETLCNSEHYLFALSDLRTLFPGKSDNAFKTLISRAQRDGLLQRVCRGIYLYDRVDFPRGYVLFHTASRLRAGHFNYLSLETVLSDEGIISQIPINRITLMSSGRSHIVSCGKWGSIEFIHTKKQPSRISSRLHYNSDLKLWRAENDLAIEDLKTVGRNLDLINWNLIDDTV